MKNINQWFPVQDSGTNRISSDLGLTEERYEYLVEKVNALMKAAVEHKVPLSMALGEASRYAMNPGELALISFSIGLMVGTQKTTHDILTTQNPN